MTTLARVSRRVQTATPQPALAVPALPERPPAPGRLPRDDHGYHNGPARRGRHRQRHPRQPIVVQLVLWFKAALVAAGAMTPSHLGAAARSGFGGLQPVAVTPITGTNRPERCRTQVDPGDSFMPGHRQCWTSWPSFASTRSRLLGTAKWLGGRSRHITLHAGVQAGGCGHPGERAGVEVIARTFA
jgi:hypothetical protein